MAHTRACGTHQTFRPLWTFRHSHFNRLCEESGEGSIRQSSMMKREGALSWKSLGIRAGRALTGRIAVAWLSDIVHL